MDELNNSPEIIESNEELNEDEEKELKASLNLTKKVVNKLLTFIICGGIFLLMLSFNIHNKLSGEVSSGATTDYINIIGYITIGISGIFCLLFIINSLLHNKLITWFHDLASNIKNLIAIYLGTCLVHLFYFLNLQIII